MNTSNDNTSPTLSELRDKDDIDFLGLLDVVLEARWLIVAVTLGTALLGGIYAFLSQPVYEADSLIQVEQSQGTSSNLLSEMSTLFDVQSPASAEIEILRSRLVVGHAVDNLQLYLSASPKYLPFIGSWLAGRATALSEPGFLGLGGYVSGTESIRLGQLDVPPALEGQTLALLATAGGYELLDADGLKLAEGKVGVPSDFKADGAPGRILVNELKGKPGAEFTLV
ncbi:MAG: Wzz/FepE/Etk N-terminal domain-containing protein, partial [Pollutimonas bauzanensis]